MSGALLTRASLLARLGDPSDGAAWQQFVELYGSLVYGFARQRGLQDADAADLTQEVFLAIAQTAGRWHYDRRQGSFRGWLYGLTHNKIAKFFQRRRGQAIGTGRQQRPAAAGRGAWPGAGPGSGLGTGVSATALPSGRRSGPEALRSDDLAGLLADRRRGPERRCRRRGAGAFRRRRLRGPQSRPGTAERAGSANAILAFQFGVLIRVAGDDVSFSRDAQRSRQTRAPLCVAAKRRRNSENNRPCVLRTQNSELRTSVVLPRVACSGCSRRRPRRKTRLHL